MYIIENDNQRPYWELTYKNGVVVRESDTNTFQSIIKDLLLSFKLVQPNMYEFELNCETGVFTVNHKKVDTNTILNNLGHQHLNYGAGLIQFKSARVLIGSQGASDEILDTANLGYKVSLNGFLYQFIITHDYNIDINILEIKVTDLNNKNSEVERIALW